MDSQDYRIDGDKVSERWQGKYRHPVSAPWEAPVLDECPRCGRMMRRREWSMMTTWDCNERRGGSRWVRR